MQKRQILRRGFLVTAELNTLLYEKAMDKSEEENVDDVARAVKLLFYHSTVFIFN